MSGLRINPDPVKVVSDNRRAAWEPHRERWRCTHEDGRGRCRSRLTGVVQIDGNWEARCEKHRP